MAKLISALKISGTINDLMFCKQRKGGVTVQSKGGPSRFNVLFNKRFARTRQNYREYQGAIQSATLVRRGLGFLWHSASSQLLSGRMNKLLHQVVVSDTESMDGPRRAHKGNVQLLEGFDYNHELSLDSALPVNLQYSMDAEQGHARLVVPSHIVRHKRNFPKKATHFKIVSCLSAMHFGERRGRYQVVESSLLPLSQQMEAHEMEHHLPGEAGEVLVHTVGIVFFMLQGETFKPLSGGALRIVQVARIKEHSLALTPTDAKGRTVQLQHQRQQKLTTQQFKLEAPKKRRTRRGKKKQGVPLLLSLMSLILLPVLLLVRRL
jgi:hypothetical protein